MKPKNILFLMCDQLNFRVLNRAIREGWAPNLAALAQKSACFDKAYCQTPICTPSRGSIVTGLYPHTSGLVSNIMRRDYPVFGGPETEEGIKNSDCTTEKLLWQKGWQTGHVGKWHLLDEDLEYYPHMYREHYEYADEMADTFRDIAEHFERDSYMNWYGWKLPVQTADSFRRAVSHLDDQLKTVDMLSDFYTKIGALAFKTENTFDYRVASRAVEFLQNTEDRPFMLTCSFNAPHDPNVVPFPYYEKAGELAEMFPDNDFCEELFRTDLSYQVPEQAGTEFLREFTRVYHACILYIDEQVGRVLNALEQSGKAEDTILVFAADHGDMVGAHSMFWKCTDAFYDEVSRVPLMISCPDRLPAGHYDFPAELVDLMPTLLELCSVEIPAHVQGKSLLPYCKGEKPSDSLTAFSERLYWNSTHTRVQRHHRNFHFMLRDARYKYCVHQKNDTPSEYLYDMEQDPGEVHSLTSDPAAQPLLRRMRAALREHLEKTGCSSDYSL